MVDASPLRSIYSPIEIAYMHYDSSSYGWGAMFNEQLEARAEDKYSGQRRINNNTSPRKS
jgi:hypothetical protein